MSLIKNDIKFMSKNDQNMFEIYLKYSKFINDTVICDNYMV